MIMQKIQWYFRYFKSFIHVRSVFVCIFRNPQEAGECLQRIRKSGYVKSAGVFHKADKSVTVDNYTLSPLYATLIGLGFGLIGTLFFVHIHLPLINSFGYNLPYGIEWLFPPLGASAGWIIFSLIDLGVDNALLKNYEKWTLHSESTIVIQANQDELSRINQIIKESPGGSAGITFLHPNMKEFPPPTQKPFLRDEPLTVDKLHWQAGRLAAAIHSVSSAKSHGQFLLKKLRVSEALLREIRGNLAETAKIEQSLPLAAEWLLDNMYIVQSHIDDIKRNLPRKYYNELPVINQGALSELPRIYAIAFEMVSDTDGRLDRDIITNFIQSYQSYRSEQHNATLTMGELWAIPLMLRMSLVECIHYLAVDVNRRLWEREKADFWSNRLQNAVRNDPDYLLDILAELAHEHPEPSPYFADELASRLFDEENALNPVRTWLERKLNMPLADAIREEQRKQTLEQVSLANSITSLRQLSQLDWRHVFENLCRVDAVLWTDPASVYSKMNFHTRDQYRHVIETISRRTGLTEDEVAMKALELADEGSDDVTRHVGYYLIDKGRIELERHLGYHPPLMESLRRKITSRPGLSYISAITLLTLLTLAFPILKLFSVLGSWVFPALLSLLLIPPASEIAVQLANYLFTHLLPPQPIPRMDFKSGIPAEYKTLVVVPTLLSSPEAIKEEIERLEIRYLANRDQNILFSLFSDYVDAPSMQMPVDEEQLDLAIHGIEELNAKYDEEAFLLFHRDRTWCPSENCWMGWERKRGKLEQLNRFLVGEGGKELDYLLRTGDPERLRNIRFVITLDSDTQLPCDTAKRMIETLAHPLNCPHVNEEKLKLDRGYAIIQPLVSSSLPSATSTFFSSIFTDARGVDPYTHVISDIYQDLSGEGSYHGKGIYDLHAFHAILEGRFPDSHLLSHDLIEGIHARVGYASDIELFDLFPQNYLSYCSRQHRWIRGDWQIADWLKSNPPKGYHPKPPNPISIINKWKILDNLRRSLLPVFMLASFILGWLAFPTLWWVTLFLSCVFFMPFILKLLDMILATASGNPVHIREYLDSLLRTTLNISFTPHQASLSLDAITRVAYRKWVSHKHLMEWQTAAETHRKAKDRNNEFVLRLLWQSAFAVGIALLIAAFAPQTIVFSGIFIVLWLIAPGAVSFLNQPRKLRMQIPITSTEQRHLRLTARQTWRFFDQFVTESTHWLPPDNYQEFMTREIARRTSPTNIGLYLLSCAAAYDFGYETIAATILRCLNTVQTLQELEKFEGHLLNWYDTSTIEPLQPAYISMVDSGNLQASLWTMEHAVLDMMDAPLIDAKALRGLADTHSVLGLAMESARKHEPHCDTLHSELGKLLSHIPESFPGQIKKLRNFLKLSLVTKNDVCDTPGMDASCCEWASMILYHSKQWDELINIYLGWAQMLVPPMQVSLLPLGQEAHEWRRQALSSCPSLRNIATGAVPGLSSFLAIHSRMDTLSLPESLQEWLNRLAQLADEARLEAIKLLETGNNLIQSMHDLATNIRMDYLYDPERRVFHTGYNVTDRRMDNSFYDLLASEARLGSLTAIASGQVPAEHWWALGRPYGLAFGKRPLLSWSGTMFEYLMPLLMMKRFENSLIDQACVTAVQLQVEYSRRRGIPWGISEAAYSALDSHQTYQYRAFGVPGLGLKRGLEEDLVVAPYATALALMTHPSLAYRNLRRMEKLGRLGQRSRYGYFEAIDYTRQTSSQGERGVIVYSYMAHHQGMILLSLDNVLNSNIIQKRFHSDPRVKAVESLLYERIPIHPPVAKDYAREAPPPRLTPIPTVSGMGRLEITNTLAPKTLLLANKEYSLMLTHAGGGYSRWRDIDITRWRADTTRDNYGSFVYLRDMDSGSEWSLSHHPIQSAEKKYAVIFSNEKAEIRCREAGIESNMEVIVSPEDNAEIRRISLYNRSLRKRSIELTSYLELAMTTHNGDISHPAFVKLFVQTEAVPEYSALMAWRRRRSPEDMQVWAGHLCAMSETSDRAFEFETDRLGFIGRNGTLRSPKSIKEPLSCSTGAVLDPVFSIRRQVNLDGGQKIQLTFVTLAAESRPELLHLIEKYADPNNITRAFDIAWTNGQIELRHLRIQQEDANQYQQLAGHILYPQMQFRTSSERLRKNEKGQSALWAYGISGDLPIAAVLIEDSSDIDLVTQALQAHSYWRLRGLKVDLLILNQETAVYSQPLHDHLRRLIQAHSQYTGIDQPGGVFLRAADQIPVEDLDLMLCVARVVMVASRGPLAQQLAGVLAPHQVADQFKPSGLVKDEPSKLLPFLELLYFNGYGGFTQDGWEYAIYLGPDTNTPAPWTNIIANPRFGTAITESGAAFTWYENSQSNRITPWSNDPVESPGGEAFYIRDEDIGSSWSPTPYPIREKDAYRCRHGIGYTRFEHNSHAIEQNLLTYVPVDDQGGMPVKVHTLTLRNESSQRRKLRITFYCEWTLGVNRENTQPHIVTTWDSDLQALTAVNHYHMDYGPCVAFIFCNHRVTSYTGDRTEFIGRNGSMSTPLAMTRTMLSRRVGPALDPCGAIQTYVEIEPKQSVSIDFLLGEAESQEEMRSIIRRFRADGVCESMFKASQEWWKRTLNGVQVETPTKSIDLMLNRWLPYQNLACRMWARSAFYQSGGAYGFRDQLQDSMALAYAKPNLTREHILRSAARQFTEGDVQHWWHEPAGLGVRTRISDDLLWLPWVVHHYVQVTGDYQILSEEVPFIKADPLGADEHDRMSIPTVLPERFSLLEHCMRAINRSLQALGEYGIPLMGDGDWNDGMNRIGAEGKGESVWLAWFLIRILNDFSNLPGLDENESNRLRMKAQEITRNVEAAAWDGEWYRRAWYDDGTPVGSIHSDEDQIDSLPQSWAVISGAADAQRAKQSIESAKRLLMDKDAGIIKLFTPPFDKTTKDPGYIKGYPPGIRENGGQYTHGSLWLPLAFALIGDGDTAVEMLEMMNPIERARTIDNALTYAVEPYVTAGDVYALPGKVGRGGWSWYSGSAGWMYRIWIEHILGFKKRGEILEIDPVISSKWRRFTLTYAYKSASYVITVENPEGVRRGVIRVEMDGRLLTEGRISLQDDGGRHQVRVVLGSGGKSDGLRRVTPDIHMAAKET